MRAIMLAAGRGIRLNGGEGLPKALLAIEGKTLLRRHFETLAALGIDRLTLVVGFRAEAIAEELAQIGAGDWVETVHNPDFHEGALVSLWAGRHVLRSGEDVLFMDADVLYDAAVLGRLIGSPHRNCFLIDRDLEAGEEPVKLCLAGGRIAEFGKVVTGAYDAMGEWPGFLRLAPEEASLLAAEIESRVARGVRHEPYEPAMRAVVLARPERFGWEDITGLPWIEIDTPEDLRRARETVAPALYTRKT
jgi:choline kinase